MVFVLVIAAETARSQVDDMCAEFGARPSLDSPWANVPYVFGRVTLRGWDPGAALPKVVIVLIDPQQTQKRLTIEKNGNYCFRKTSSGGGTLILEVDGVEVARRSLATFGPAQQREDFEVHNPASKQSAPPGVISTKFSHPPNERTKELYQKAAEAEQEKDRERAIGHLKEIVFVDPADFIAWAKLGTLYLERASFPDAESAFRRSLELKPEYTPAWINAGKLRIARKQYEAAVEVFKVAVDLEPQSARGHQLLGEAYLLARQGTLGAASLNRAIELDPIGMAECHLQLAHLYRLAKANHLAAEEYRKLLAKVPDHPERKKLEKFIADNSEK